MRKELDNALCEKYPEIFADRYGDMRTTAMYWGFECGDGWYTILDTLCHNIQSYIENIRYDIDWTIAWNAMVESGEPWPDRYAAREKRDIPKPVKVVAIQVKEKFGTLRFYYSGGDDYISGLVRMAEAMSYNTCEVCGSPGTANKEGWISVRCDEHR